jgi:hypothetical protein
MVGWPIQTPLLKGDWQIDTQRNAICWLCRKLEESRSAHDGMNMKDLVNTRQKKLSTQLFWIIIRTWQQIVKN